MRIGIFGGTFDPPHIGHIRACKAFVDSIELDELYVIPVYMPPHKMQKSNTDVSSRLEMTKIAFSSLSSKIVVSDIEIKREGKSYTADTIRYFKENYNDAEILFLCGTDMILTMDFWYKPEYIFKNATIVYVRRETDKENTEKISKKCAYYEEKFGAKIIYLDVDAIEISSTEIREAIGNEDKLKQLVTDEIYNYIQENRLYLDKEI